MGTVWLAEDSLLKRSVAVKEIDIPPGFDAEERDALEARLLREARAAARLSHPGVVSVYDVVEHGERPWIVMEYVDGLTLDEIVEESGALSPEETARIGLELCSILEVAHAEGIVHRDVKPGNVMRTPEGQVKLADFGIASVQDDPKITQTGLVLGSPAFMSPEQASKGTSGPEGDVWSLGATLYQAVEGKPPFDRGAPLPTLTAVMTDEPRPMEKAGPLAPVILRLLDKDPAGRPSLVEARELLATLGEGTTVALAGSAAPTLVEEREPKPVAQPRTTPAPIARTTDEDRRTWWPWALLVAGIAALILVPMLLSSGDEKAGAGNPQANERDRETQEGAGADTTDTDTDADTDGGTVVTDELTTYTDPTNGYTIRYPATWDPIVRDDFTTDFTDPETGTYLRVAWTDAPGDDVMARLREIADGFAAEHDNYSEIQMTPTEFLGYEAGLWEYTYEDGTALHAYNLQFVQDETYGFALNFQTHEEDWDGSQEMWEQLKATFEPPA